MWKTYNPNPDYQKVGDCTIRAISKALNKSWEDTYLDLCVYGLMYSDMPSANHVWGAYLHAQGFRRYFVEDQTGHYTVRDFAVEHPEGTYILALSGHVVCLKDSDYYDTWDSGYEPVIFYWRRENNV